MKCWSAQADSPVNFFLEVIQEIIFVGMQNKTDFFAFCTLTQVGHLSKVDVRLNNFRQQSLKIDEHRHDMIMNHNAVAKVVR